MFLNRRVDRLELPVGRDVEVEIGCADARFLFGRARQDARRLCIGLEIRHELIDGVNARAREEGLPVRAVFANATVELTQLFAPASLARVFVNFPDPWFKRRHRKRRLLDAELVGDIVRLLRPGGELLVQTDVWDLALDALAVIEEEPDLVNVAGEWSFLKGSHSYRTTSRREEACVAEGLPIWRMAYVRVVASAGGHPLVHHGG